jgi:hypothetical protein
MKAGSHYSDFEDTSFAKQGGAIKQRNVTLFFMMVTHEQPPSFTFQMSDIAS